MSLLWYFVSVPDLPHEVKDQNKAVEIIQYLTAEEMMIDVGTPLVRVKTWWAVIELISTTKGQIEKNLFDNPVIRGSRVPIGQPLALVFADVDDRSDAKAPYCEIRVVQTLRVKP